MKARSLSHAGITVSDFNKAVRFYSDIFGCPLVGVVGRGFQVGELAFLDFFGGTCRVEHPRHLVSPCGSRSLRANVAPIRHQTACGRSSA